MRFASSCFIRVVDRDLFLSIVPIVLFAVLLVKKLIVVVVTFSVGVGPKVVLNTDIHFNTFPFLFCFANTQKRRNLTPSM